MIETIEVGDMVLIEIVHGRFIQGEVLHMPCAAWDCWRIMKTLAPSASGYLPADENSLLYYVQQFLTMRLMFSPRQQPRASSTSSGTQPQT